MNHYEDEVLSTLTSVLALNYKNYEIVLVGDDSSNTLSPKLKRLSNTIKINFINSRSANKGKLLNIALASTHKDAQYVFIVEPAREVQSHVLSKGVETILDTDHKFVQFALAPIVGQRYNSDSKLQDVYLDQAYAQAGTDHDIALLSGELTLIDKSALLEIACWVESNKACELKTGMRLQSAGHIGKNIHTQMTNVTSIFNGPYKIKIRNYIRLRSMFWSLSLRDFKGLTKQQSLVLFLQMSSWQNFLIVPLSLFTLKAAKLFYPEIPITIPEGSSFIAGATIIGSFYFHILFLLQKLSMSVKTPHIFGLFFTNLACYFESSLLLALNTKLRSILILRSVQFLSYTILLTCAVLISYKLMHTSQDIAGLTPAFTAVFIIVGALLSRSENEHYNIDIFQNKTDAFAKPG